MALSVCVLHSPRDVPHLAVARLLFDRSGQPDSEGHLPTDLPDKAVFGREARIHLEIALAKKRKFVRRFNAGSTALPRIEKNVLRFSEGYDCLVPSRLDKRGATRSSRSVRRGCGGRVSCAIDDARA